MNKNSVIYRDEQYVIVSIINIIIMTIIIVRMSFHGGCLLHNICMLRHTLKGSAVHHFFRLYFHF